MSLSPDDPAIYGYQGVTHDFWEAVAAWNLDLASVKFLCLRSLSLSRLSESDKEQAIVTWKERWQKWAKEVSS